MKRGAVDAKVIVAERRVEFTVQAGLALPQTFSLDFWVIKATAAGIMNAENEQETAACGALVTARELPKQGGDAGIIPLHGQGGEHGQGKP